MTSSGAVNEQRFNALNLLTELITKTSEKKITECEDGNGIYFCGYMFINT